MSRIQLIAASDDYLLEERLSAAVTALCAELGDVEPEIQNEEATPESVATELVSPSLFASQRVIVVPDARVWLGASAPPGLKTGKISPPDPQPLVHVLEEGLPEGMALIMGAWCGRKPSGPLVEVMEKSGTAEWIPLPPPPKPWENAVLSSDQLRILEAVLRKAAGEVRFSRGAARMLLERLGFAPRLLVQEVRKLAGAAGDGEVDEELVRDLTFPRERSLEVVRDAVLDRKLEPLLDLVAAASSGTPINDWQGQRLDPGGFAIVLHGLVTNLLMQMLYLRRVAAATGLAREMEEGSSAGGAWYNRRFKPGIAPELLGRLKEDAPSPLVRPGGKPPTPYSLGAVFAGAGRYTDDELMEAVDRSSETEVALRQNAFSLAALTVWLSALVGDRDRSSRGRTR